MTSQRFVKISVPLVGWQDKNSHICPSKCPEFVCYTSLRRPRLLDEMKSNYYQFLAFAGLVLAGSCLKAAVFPRITAEELTAQSQLIVEGSIVRSWTAWDSAHKYVWTHYELAVTDAIRGTRGPTVTVSEPGGSLDGIHQQFSGAVPYWIGENAVLFLYKTPIGYWRAAGGPQGKFTVEPDGRIRANTQDAAFFDPAGRPSPGTSLSSFNGLNVADFKSQFRRFALVHPFVQK